MHQSPYRKRLAYHVARPLFRSCKQHGTNDAAEECSFGGLRITGIPALCPPISRKNPTLAALPGRGRLYDAPPGRPERSSGWVWEGVSISSRRAVSSASRRVLWMVLPSPRQKLAVATPQ